MECKAEYLKNNINTRNININKYTDEYINNLKQKIQQKTRIIKYYEEDAYFVVVNGRKMQFEYEEMVELLSAMRDCSIGNESFLNSKIKADMMKKFLPITDY